MLHAGVGAQKGTGTSGLSCAGEKGMQGLARKCIGTEFPVRLYTVAAHSYTLTFTYAYSGSNLQPPTSNLKPQTSDQSWLPVSSAACLAPLDSPSPSLAIRPPVLLHLLSITRPVTSYRQADDTACSAPAWTTVGWMSCRSGNLAGLAERQGRQRMQLGMSGRYGDDAQTLAWRSGFLRVSSSLTRNQATSRPQATAIPISGGAGCPACLAEARITFHRLEFLSLFHHLPAQGFP